MLITVPGFRGQVSVVGAHGLKNGDHVILDYPGIDAALLYLGTNDTGTTLGTINDPVTATLTYRTGNDLTLLSQAIRDVAAKGVMYVVHLQCNNCKTLKKGV